MARRLREESLTVFTDIEFGEALTLWKSKAHNTEPTKRSASGIQRVEVERAVGQMLMSGDESKLADIAEEVKQIVQAALEDESHAGDQDVNKASSSDTISVVEVDRTLLSMVRARSTENEWGGVIEVSADRAGVLTQSTVFKSWTPFTLAPIANELKKFVDEELAPQSVLEALQKLSQCRARLLPFASQLSVSPVATLAGEAGLLTEADTYLESYEQLLRQLHACYAEMLSAADAEAESILGLLLCLELYVYKSDTHFEVVMSPLHPLFLWRSTTLVREIRGLGRVLSAHEILTVEEACAENFQFLQVLVLPRQATGSDHAVLLGQAGALGRLPVFREAPRGMLETDGLRTVGDLAQHLARLRPFVRPGLQVVFVNLPRPAKFIDELLTRLDLESTGVEDTYWGLHVRVRYTHNDTRGWSNDVDLEEEVQELLSNGEERGLVSLSVQGEIVPWAKLQRELTDKPSHLTVVFDPFEVRSTPVARAQTHALSPWMPTVEYRFNKIRKEVQVIPVAEEHVFGSYLAAASLVHTALQRKTPAHLPQVREVRDILDDLARNSTWTVVADPHRVPLARLGGAEVIDRRIERGRQLTCFSHDLSPFRRRLDEQLRLTHFSADQHTLEQLVRDLVAMEPNGILGLASTNHDKQVKGSLGKLIAVRWYRTQTPSGLAVSLDTPAAARWLVAGHHSREKADLLGLRDEEGQLIIDVIEVKAHDQAIPYSISNGKIEGRPVGQVLATMQALAEVFSPDSTSPLARPRREVLREHLYTALLRDQDPVFVERWHALLQDVFEGKVPVRLAARIIHVQLASVAKKESKTFLSAGRIPITVDTLSAADVGLVLKAVRPIVIEPSVAETAVGVETPDRIEPSVALKLLLAPPPVPVEASDSQSTTLRISEPSPPNVDRSSECAAPPLPVRATDSANEVFVSVQLGHEHAASTNVVWQPARQSNGFFLILGASGSGKTETLKVIGSSISGAGVPVLIFDFHGDVILPGVRNILMSSGSASTIGLNPMELDSRSAEESGLYDQRATLRGMVQRAVPALGHRQGSILREVFDESYRRAGILDSEPSSWTLPAPDFGDLLRILEEWTEDPARKAQRNAIEGCIAAVQELFDHPIFQRDERLSIDELLQKSLRLDLSKLPDQVRFIATETLLRKIFRVLRLRGPIPVQPVDDLQRFRLFVVIDEAKILSLGGSGDRDRADNILNQLITEARKFGLGMILASQMSEHFSEEVRANASTWLVLKPMDIREAKKNAPNVSVDADDLIRLAGRGDGYYRDRPSSRARRIQVRPLGDG
ncbi:helicase HerA-like domain-containing protein [Hydrocarboniphaga sp.]|uniref:ATP-binding protein n=1 Tax=Hydrocarboniphaga sp. TaxID=2033016 RepID=UPI00261CEE65|nr:helicase HerA-like domain-containing protein [Hydrocarboniphaga sp.]